MVEKLCNPKRPNGSNDRSRARWFPYYAGYSTHFVEDVLSHLQLPKNAKLLDPWLGSGTTSEVAAANKYRIRGFDLNPAMLVVAKARTVASGSDRELLVLSERISARFSSSIRRARKHARTMDALDQWLVPDSAFTFRLLERTVAATCGLERRSSREPTWRHLEQASPITAVLYVALFRTLRRYLQEFQASNPTWTKVPVDADRIELSASTIIRSFRQELHLVARGLREESRETPPLPTGACSIRRASSVRLPMASESVDAIISSPPYCTRIDYVRATLPELAVVGCPNGAWLRALREQMIGTPTIRRNDAAWTDAWGASCARFLTAVRRHPSKASETYYLKYFHQYFASVQKSLSEIHRVLKRGGRCVLVVQDSYYKDVRNDLPAVFTEMAVNFGWQLTDRVDFHVKRTLRAINANAKKYPTPLKRNRSCLDVHQGPMS